MPVTIVVGGQYGSEGKGKVAHYFSQQRGVKVAVRVGGSNSGHTVYDEKGNRYVFRMLPTAAITKDVFCIMPSGSYLDLDILFSEMTLCGLNPQRLKIDPNAVVVSGEQKKLENGSGLRESIGSTLSGTGVAVADRASRNGRVRLAKDEPQLQRFLLPTKEFMRSFISAGDHIIIEGTQGYGLSVLHSVHYPFATSRDTSAAGALSETGLSPLDVQNVVLVIRAYPIRVAGNSGPLRDETDWATVTKESGSAVDLIEYTSVTQRVRRVADFDPVIVKQAISANNPNIIVLNHLDYIDSQTAGRSADDFIKAKKYLENTQKAIGRTIDFYGTCPITLRS